MIDKLDKKWLEIQKWLEEYDNFLKSIENFFWFELDLAVKVKNREVYEKRILSDFKTSLESSREYEWVWTYFLVRSMKRALIENSNDIQYWRIFLIPTIEYWYTTKLHFLRKKNDKIWPRKINFKERVLGILEWILPKPDLAPWKI